MRSVAFRHVLAPICASFLLISSSPAQARITVVDGGVEMTVGGYCTPGQVGNSDCAAQALPFAITVGGVTYDSFILNGNGTLTLGTTGIDWNAVSNSPPDFAAYSMPVFSPQNDNQITEQQLFNPDGFDENTTWAASVTTVPGQSLTADWFPCVTAIFCGTDSLGAALYDGPLTQQEVIERQSWGMFGLTLTDLPTGFQLGYFYNPVHSPTGTYGFNLPGAASLQVTGTLANRSWIFDSLGRVTAVPEPGTWLTMLLGFASVGLALRRQRKPALRTA